ncbi:imidazolonepropionase [Tsuneonella dongtanensis]|uniref:Imidazolonepropionase n=1 Tax=Tsuneonella dongtanensis TaxID=692370 RepID=A0A1B2AGI7_9SPHN|nr:amidohydrolase family protein [Tsuneonella dongtanensis]ANY21273.1 imidazolonepropionase [Tsuneonella dongtanensis]
MRGLGRLACAAAALAIGISAQVSSAQEAAPRTTVIHADRVVVDAQSPVRGQSTVIVTDGRIVGIEDGFVDGPVGAEMVHLAGKTLVPGLTDLHTHISGDPTGEYWRAAIDPPEWFTMLAVKNAGKTVRAGFTTIRDLGSRTPQVTQALRRATAEGLVVGPRVVTSGQTIAIVGGHGDTSGFRSDVNDLLASGMACTGPVECAEKVRRASKAGADLVKITATGGVLSQQGRGLEAHFTDAEMQSIVDTAKTLGLNVAAHAHGARGIEAASRAGVQTIEHGTYLDDGAIAEMKKNGTVLIPTLMAFQGISQRLGKGVYTPVVETKVRAVADAAGVFLRKALKAGVKVAFGTDAGVFEHGLNAREFGLMMAQGMSSRDALAAATTGAAEVLGLSGEIGRIAPGYSADIIAVEGDPTQDARVLEKVDWVMARGRVID